MEITIPWTNDSTAYARQFTINPKGQFESEWSTARATPKAGILTGEFLPGTLFRFQENGADTQFLLLKHGYPTASTEKSLVIRKDLTGKVTWGNMNTWLNDTYLPRLSDEVKTLIEPVDIPYNGSTVNLKVFSLSGSECFGERASYVTEGEQIPYFDSDEKRKAYYSGTAYNYILRTRHATNGEYCIDVHKSGSQGTEYKVNANYVRPAFTIPSDTLFNHEPNTDGSYSLYTGGTT